MRYLSALVAELALVAIGLWCNSTPVMADSIFGDAIVKHGAIISIDPKDVTFKEGCGQDPPIKVSWTDISDIIFDTKCDSSSAKPNAAGGGICTGTVSTRFELFKKTGGKPIVADEIQLSTNGTINFTDAKKGIVGHGPVGDLIGIRRGQVCDDNVDSGLVPPSFCVEPRQFAVRFSYDAPLENKILTKGFSFYPEFIPDESVSTEERDAIIATIRTGFGTAVTNWFAGLLNRGDKEDNKLYTFVQSLVSKSQKGGLEMLIPPQVIALQCPQAATFIVRIYKAHRGPFIAGSDLKVAYAGNPGRTVVLNFVDFPCWTEGLFSFIYDKDKKCINIDAILTHELGHAFGLGHVDEKDSIMTPYISVMKPSPRDIDRLAEKLIQSIDGAKAGEITFTTDNGVAIEQAP